MGSELVNSVDSQTVYARMLIRLRTEQLPESVYRRVCEDPELNGLEVSQAILKVYNGIMLTPLGRKRIGVRNPNNNTKYNLSSSSETTRYTKITSMQSLLNSSLNSSATSSFRLLVKKTYLCLEHLLFKECNLLL